MKPATQGVRLQNRIIILARCFLAALALLFSSAATVRAQAPDPGWSTNGSYYGQPQMAWSFVDTNSWKDDAGYAPVSFTNLTASLLGDGTAVVVDSPEPAWLQYNVTEPDGTNNLTVDVGSVVLWFAPNWTGTNAGGTGPGTWGRLLEVGSVNSNGWWSLYVDPEGANLYFTVQTNGGSPVTYLSAPIDWAITNRWHQLALTYSATNTALYVDDFLASSGPGLTNFPGAEALANGFFIGSGSDGDSQAHGMFDDLYTYNYPVSYGTLSAEYMTGMIYFLLNPLNAANYSSAPSTPSTTTYNIIAGTGNLQYLGASGGCVNSSNVWMTNVSATATSQPMTFTFTIAGGTYGQMYDVFTSPVLTPQRTNGLWSWMGQGGTCSIYALTNLPTSGAVFFILGTALDTDGDGLTDAYEKLVSHTDPNKADTDGDGIPDGWAVYLGLNPNGNDPGSFSSRANFSYTLAEWLSGAGGARTGTVGTDAEGNVTAVSQ